MTIAHDIVLVVCAASISGFAAYLLLRTPRLNVAPAAPCDDGIGYLFDQDILHHATDAADDFEPLDPGYHTWSDLHDAVSDRFPQFPAQPKTAGGGTLTLTAQDGKTPRGVTITWQDGTSRVMFRDDVLAQADRDQPLIQRIEASLGVSVWHVDSAGKLLWSNKAYKTLCEAVTQEGEPRIEPLFALGQDEGRKRIPLRLSEIGKPDWYEITRTDVDGIACYQASCISALVHAEEAQRNFVQTLTKTFAQLSIGLAIFDRNSQLALFNPALVDLTGLRAEFLSARPAVQTFFDRLRETRKMPEPKSYINWRNAITDMIRAAHDGRYEEVWSLDNGQTFRVKGRPHPDGATAFLIEDITSEISLTRTFRAELELVQSMLDTFDDGAVVFSASGVLTFSNLAYQKMWGVEPGLGFADTTIFDAIQVWKCKSAPTPMWQEIEDFVRNFGDRKAWDMPLYLSDGTALTCMISPIVAGATLIRFHRGRLAVAPVSDPQPEPAELGG